MMSDVTSDQQIVDDEIVFVDLPELSRFEIFEGMKVMIENINFNDTNENMDFNLVIQPRDEPEQESMTLKFQGKNMETVGTCLFFADSEPIDRDSSEGEPKASITEKDIQNDRIEDKDVEMNDECRVQSDLERKSYSETRNGESDIVNDVSKSKLLCIGKCKKVVQAFIED
ncbi:uncharacterized protein cubi_03234 [Cryptosporidium ubiquitum]|uniref:Uncharacterized protein n=1 Tax=Cryptosporidium ubiquitum TaxID=857276 RepID=A0A1J4M9N7_9CRYT|nr:uncharacterized protein cubi_03234 [Cryptosporidium ubiquitum]OII70936.1 hypothetical protein cubi_03234 [Cryptosporidium ubiquitum]